MTRTMPLILLVATLAFLAAPAVTPPFMGYDPGLFPVRIERPSIQPAGYSFAIWGPIYLWLIAHAAMGLIWRSTDAAWARPRPALIGAVALGAIWLAIAAGYPMTATAAIILMAVLALTAFLSAEPDRDRWMMSAPLGMFAGWLTAASAVSSGVILAGYGWLSDTATALTLLAVVLSIALTVQRQRPAMPVYGATVVWAIIGVMVVNWTANPPVAYAAVAGAAIMAAATIIIWLRR